MNENIHALVANKKY